MIYRCISKGVEFFLSLINRTGESSRHRERELSIIHMYIHNMFYQKRNHLNQKEKKKKKTSYVSYVHCGICTLYIAIISIQTPGRPPCHHPPFGSPCPIGLFFSFFFFCKVQVLSYHTTYV